MPKVLFYLSAIIASGPRPAFEDCLCKREKKRKNERKGKCAEKNMPVSSFEGINKL